MVLENWASFISIADSVSRSGRAGDNKTKEQALAVILQGAELGIPPMTATRWLYPIEGGLTMSAPCAQALIYRDCPGSKFKIETTETYCEVTVEIPGREPVTERYTLEDAKRAGLIKPKSGWEKHPKDHLFANAMRRACTRAAPDVTGGLLAPEEFGIDSNVIDIPPASVKTAPAVAVPIEQPKPAATEPVDVTDTTATESTPAVATSDGNGNGHPNVSHPDPGQPKATPSPAATAQLLEMKRIKESLKIKDPEWVELITPFNVASARALNSDQAKQLLDVLKKRQAAIDPATVGAAKN